MKYGYKIRCAMKTKIIQDYLSRTLVCDITLSVESLNTLPFFVRKLFDFYSGNIFSKKVFFLIAKDDFFFGHAIQELESASAIFRDKLEQIPVFIFSVLTHHERQMLIKRGIQFLVPGTQMFLPCLGIDFFERIKAKRAKSQTQLRPAAQAILLEQLLTGKIHGLILSQTAQLMGYTPMGVLRAAGQLEELKLCNIHFDGFRKTIHFELDKEQLWNKALPILRTPVKKVISVEDDTILANTYPFAGEYALARYSNLAVSRKCYAVPDSTYSRLTKDNKLLLADSADGGIADIQVWSYMLPDAGETVDLLSLKLSFQGTNEPRIQEALLDISESKTW